MPKDTFINLNDQKKIKIIEASLEEFAKYPYEYASLTRIVSKLGIAKGSMYQYFENKRDLYMYIVRIVQERKREYLQPVFYLNKDFFSTIVDYYEKSYLFALEYPLYHQIGMNFWDSKDEQLKEEILQTKQLRALEFYKWLSEAADNGEVNPNLSKEAVFFVYHSVGKELIDNFLTFSKNDITENIEFIKKVLELVKYGLKRRNKEEKL